MSKNYLLSPYAFDILFPSEQNVIIALRQNIPFDLSIYNETQIKLLKKTIGQDCLDEPLRESLSDCLALMINGFKCGDRIVFPINEEVFLIGNIEGDYIFEESAHFQHRHLVFWKSTVVLNGDSPLSEETQEFRHLMNQMMTARSFLFAEVTSEVFSSLEQHAVSDIDEPAIRRSIMQALKNRASGQSTSNDYYIYPAVYDNQARVEDLLKQDRKTSVKSIPKKKRATIGRQILKKISTIRDSYTLPGLYDTETSYEDSCENETEYVTFMDRVRNVFKRTSKPEPEPLTSSFPQKPDAQDSAHEQLTHFATFAPNEIYPDYWGTIQVYLFPIESWGTVQALAHDIDPETKVKGFKPLSLVLQMNDRITCELECFEGGVNIPEPSEDMIWKGEMLSTSFLLKVPAPFKKPSIALRVIVSVNGAPVGQMMFTMRVANHNSYGPPPDLHQYAHVESKGFKKVFISYSHMDKSWAELLAEIYHLHGLEYFLDTHSLEAGEVFNESICEHIDESDLFLLLWSENAKQSDYVRKEYLHAMDRAYPQIKKEDAKISIKPLVITPPADPPKEMKNIYNFKRLHG